MLFIYKIYKRIAQSYSIIAEVWKSTIVTGNSDVFPCFKAPTHKKKKRKDGAESSASGNHFDFPSSSLDKRNLQSLAELDPSLILSFLPDSY